MSIINLQKKNKKNTRVVTVVCALILGLGVLTACGESRVPTEEDLSVDSNGATGLGIQVGSTYSDLVKAYGDFSIQQVSEDGTFTPITLPEPDEGVELVTEDERLSVSGFFIDDAAVKSEDVPEDEIQTNEYLNKHKVIYRYIIFTISDNVVSDIECDYLDYNNELYR